jgi:alpha-mannosidase
LRLLNFTGQTRSGLVRLGSNAGLSGAALATADGVTPIQQVVSADGSAAFAACVSNMAPLGWTGAQVVAGGTASATSSLSVSTGHLENERLRVAFDDKGEITSVFDKTRNRETLAPGGRANRLIAYEDKPMNWDAWDIDRYFEEQSWPLADGPATVTVVETGPHRAAIRVERRYQKSLIIQVVSLEVGARQIEFDTFIDWQERAQVIKAQFPFDLNTSEIRSEIQFGHVKRPTHRNTTWDRARFEASMHRWVDLSEADFGIALLNDNKYAYDCLEQSVRLTVVRGSTHPHPEADLGEHRLRYALFVHDGIADLADVHRAAERFNNPVAAVGSLAPSSAATTDFGQFSFARVDVSNVTLETVKKAEKSDAVVLRVFEHANIRAEATIRFGIPVRTVRTVNLMEEEPSAPLDIKDNAVTLSLRPFEIATLLIET